MRAAALAALLLFAGGDALAYEEAAYTVVRQEDDFELRRYEPLLVAETEVVGDFDEVGNEAFRILVAFIGGANERREKIAMTAPVTQSTGEAEGAYVFQFVMPAEYTLETLPEPKDPRIQIRQLPPRLVAARRYSGFWSQQRYRAQEELLLGSLERAGLEAVGTPIYARYNSPFSLWFLRRNEVLVEVREADGEL